MFTNVIGTWNKKFFVYNLSINGLCYFQDEWRYLLAGGTSKPEEIPNPSPDWIAERSWNDIQTLSALPTFSTFATEFKDHLEDFKRLFDSPEPHKCVDN